MGDFVHADPGAALGHDQDNANTARHTVTGGAQGDLLVWNGSTVASANTILAANNGNWTLAASTGTVELRFHAVANTGVQKTRFLLNATGDMEIQIADTAGVYHNSLNLHSLSTLMTLVQGGANLYALSGTTKVGFFKCATADWEDTGAVEKARIENSIIGTDGGLLDFYVKVDGGNLTKFARLTSGSFNLTNNLELTEETLPGNAPANACYVFARDNGSGKTQLCAIFPTGSVQILSTEP